MKIGILTLSCAINFGEIMQEFALVQKMNQLFGENTAEVVDYQNRQIAAQYRLVEARYGNSFLKRLVKTILRFPIKAARRRKFQQFRRKFIPMSQTVYTEETISKAANRYSAFVAGSDQIWNLGLTGNDTNYFLCFAGNTPKFAYAASMGSYCFSQEECRRVIPLLNAFQAISVRETGSNLLEDSGLALEAACTLDPIFLWDATFWEGVAEKPRRKGYILVYLLSKDVNMVAFAKNLSRKTGLQILLINDRPYNYPELTHLLCPSPQEYLGLFAGADYIVTNSFHGTVYALLFHKDFYTEILKKDGEANVRAEFLLKRLNLSERMIVSTRMEDVPTIDWEATDNVLRKERERSVDFLKQINIAGKTN